MREQFKRKWKFVIPMLLWCIAGVVNHGMNEVQAETYGDYEYTVLDDDTVEITGYTGSATDLEIPSVIGGQSVISIGDYAFYNCDSLSSIKIPDSVTSIGDHAFSECSSLSSITIPNIVTSIGDCAFDGCSNLSSITIPDSVTSIGEAAFRDCSSLSSITVNKGNKIYDSRDNCNAIIKTSTNELIVGCSKTIIPDSVTSIGDEAFEGCSSLSSITIPANVTYIGEAAFSECSSLSSITISDSVTYIRELAFDGCSNLSSIEIPDSVAYIGSRAFGGCSSLSSITVNEGNKIYDSRDNCNAIIKTSTNELIVGCSKTIIPDSVTSIGNYAFYECSNLSSITIPDSVTSIGVAAFDRCSSLSIVELPASIEWIGNFAFSYCSKTMIVYTTKGTYAAEWAEGNGYQVKYIEKDSPSTDENKENNNQATEATPAETPTTNPSTTTQSTNPSAITPASKGSVLQADTLKCKVKVLSEDINNPTVEYTGTTNKKSTKIKVPDTVTVDGVTYKVTKVADSALSGNKKVTSVTIGKNITAIGKNAFKNCTKLKSVDIKSTVLNQIGANAFSGDKKLTKITLKSTKLTKKSVGKNALKGTNKKLVIKVPKKKVSTYKKYFAGKGNKTVKVKK